MRSENLHTSHIDFPKHNARTLFKNSVPVSYFCSPCVYLGKSLTSHNFSKRKNQRK